MNKKRVSAFISDNKKVKAYQARRLTVNMLKGYDTHNDNKPFNLSKMEGITEKNGVPHIWGISCTRDENYRYSLAEYLGLTYWICPHCDSHLSYKEGKLFCLNNCHNKTAINKGV